MLETNTLQSGNNNIKTTDNKGSIYNEQLLFKKQ